MYYIFHFLFSFKGCCLIFLFEILIIFHLVLNDPGALLYPIYGEGELPQAFFRRAAVKGCIYVSYNGRLLQKFSS